MKKMTKLKFLLLYPFFLVLYPLLALLEFNIGEVAVQVVWRPLLIVVAAALIVIVLLYLLLRDWHRAAVITSIMILLFFTYGHVYSYLKTAEIGGFVLGRHRQLLPLWIGLAVLGVWWAVSRLKNPRALTPTLNVISLVLLIYPLAQIVSHTVRDFQIRQSVSKNLEQSVYSELPLGYAPDIYYIILDAYGRDDTLQTVFGYDNSAFLSFLQSKGFYVAQCAQSNYSHTVLSLSSSLNLNYIDAFASGLEASTDDRTQLVAAGQYNSTRKILESMGYKTVSFSTNFPISQWKDTEYYLEPPSTGMNDFEVMFAQTTAGRAFMDMIEQPPDKKFANWERRRTLFLLEQLNKNVVEIPGPKFVFAHFIIPHRPYVFDENGEETTAEFYQSGKMDYEIFLEGYTDQVKFINKNIQDVVNHILENSATKPIIIIQGDHGPDFWSIRTSDEIFEAETWDIASHRMRILNAYYFPDNSEGLYPTITPVNTFRLVFDKYFGKNYEMLKDISRFSHFGKPYDFTEIPNECGR
jgi:hypothetical protein